jgi:hypothetical protein
MTDTTRHQSWQSTHLPDHAGSIPDHNVNYGTHECWKMSLSMQHLHVAAASLPTKYLRRKFSYNCRNFWSSYILECHIILFRFKNLTFFNVLRFNFITMCGCPHSAPYMFSEIYIIQIAGSFIFELYIYTGNFYFWILLPGREIYFSGLMVPTI